MKTATPTTTRCHLAHASNTTLERLEAEFAADGFIEGQPDHVSWETLAIDLDVWGAADCPECGHIGGMGVTPYRHPHKEEYRLVICCPCCLHSHEA